jgi:hypothetical protein
MPRVEDGPRTLVMDMVGYEDVGMERHTIPLAIALQIGAAIRVVLEDRGAAIPVGEDMREPARKVEAWLSGHGGEHSELSCNKSLCIPDPTSSLHFCSASRSNATVNADDASYSSPRSRPLSGLPRLSFHMIQACSSGSLWGQERQPFLRRCPETPQRSGGVEAPRPVRATDPSLVLLISSGVVPLV